MDAVAALTTRQSPNKLEGDLPPDIILENVFGAAIRAPDHGKLRPWKFLIFKGNARVRLGEIFAESLKARVPDAPIAQLESERKKPLRAPLIIAVIAKVKEDHAKIPVIEQILSAGAAAQNIMLAFHAQGYGCMWKTGAAAYDNFVKSALGLENKDQIVGFLYAGKAEEPPEEKNKRHYSEFLEIWD